ncbi:MAG: DNA topoisomerase, partial [Desulfobacteraceae bacterium]
MVDEIRDYISNNYGKKYLPSSAMKYASKGSSQEAHEACRPADIGLTNFHGGSTDERKLYRLIWERTIASQMKATEIENISAEFATKKNKNNLLAASGRRVLFDGYQKAWSFGGTKDQILPKMQEGDKVELDSIKTEKKETKPPSRYSEASLLKSLEDKGIGRPATYASIIETIKDRGYVLVENKALKATELGMRVCDFMVDDVGFSFIDYDFTSDMESSLDLITEGKKCKEDVISKAWEALKKDIEKAKQVKVEKEKTGFNCPKCNSKLLKKTSKYGPFFTCENYNNKENKCEYKADVGDNGEPKEKVKKEIVLSDYDCPKCKEKMVLRNGKYGEFYGCSQYSKTKCNGMRDSSGKIVEQKKKKY